MLYVYTGTDRERARSAAQAAATELAGNPPTGGGTMIRISDAHSLADLSSVLQGAGMFGEEHKRVVVLDNIFANVEMRAYLMDLLPAIQRSEETFFIIEEILDAQTRRTLEKYAEASKRFDMPKGKRAGGESFALAYALRRGEKKELWLCYQRALARDEAPEALHGILFWAAKQMALSENVAERRRGLKAVAELAALPHEARRQGVELEYALERYLLNAGTSTERSRSINKG